MSFFITENISKSYISTKHGTLGFNVLYDVSLLRGKISSSDTVDAVHDFKVEVTIKWVCLSQDSCVEKLNHNNVLYFRQYRDGTFSVDDFILAYKNYGVGSIVFKEVLLIAKRYIPDAKVHLSLSCHDEKEEKGEDWENRRNSFYEKFGLKMSDNKRSYNALLKDIATDVKLENIEEVDLYEMLLKINKLNRENKELQTCCRLKENHINTCYKKREKLSKFSIYLGGSLLFFIILFIKNLT